MIKLFTALGWHFGGAEVKIDSKLTMQNVGNLLHNTSNGTFLQYIKTAVVNAWKLRDNVKGADVAVVNTDADTIELKYHTILTNLVTQIDYTDSPYTAVWGQDIEVTADGAGNTIVNLPTAVGANGKVVVVTKVAGGNSVDVTPVEEINGGATGVADTIASQWTSAQYKSNNTFITKR